jgi:ubiquinone/menaquinone biosynthesis C-methylase UbiE
MTAFRASAGRAYAAFAFGRAAVVYDLLTDHEVWRRDCRELASLVPGPRVLDLGTGPGAGALEMARAEPGKRHVGLDLSGPMLRRAATRARAARLVLPLVRGDALALPVKDGAFDGATGHSFLYLLPDPAAALAELLRAVRPGGWVAFLEPGAGIARVGEALRDGPRHALAMVMWRGMSRLHRRFDPAELAGLLSSAGFGRARAWPVLSGYGVMATAERPR